MWQIGEKRASLLNWSIGFFAGNILLCWLIGIEYLSTTPWIGTSYFSATKKFLLALFLVSSYLGQLMLVAIWPLLFIIPIVMLFPIRRVVFSTAIILASSILLWLTVDAILYNLYRFHLNGIVLRLTFNGMGENIFGLSQYEICLVFLFVVFLLILEWGYARWLWRRVQKPIFSSALKWMMLFLVFSLYISYSLIFYSANLIMNRFFIDCARMLPFYYEVMGGFIPMKNASLALSHLNSFRPTQPEKGESQLQYPLQPLIFAAKNPPQNLLVIVIDSWRFDMLTNEVTPNIYQFANESWTFAKHFSGGNATGPGIFSLLYSLPATYWTAMENQHRGPVFIDALLKEHYQVKVIGSAGLTTPAFNRTVFQAIPDIKETETQMGNTPHERDKIVTQKFKEFITSQAKSSSPFFTFLLYDSAHSFCSDEENTQPFHPTPKECVRFSFSSQRDAVPYLNLYKNALHYVDAEISEVLQTLKEQHLLDNTVVLITGDHGEEFDDNHLGYFGHAGNFTHYQVQTPLIVHFPHEKPHLYTHQTSHFDVVPTLMQRLFQVQNSPETYSVGTHLLDESERSYLIVSSYVDFGILEPQQITTIFPTGYFSIEQQNGQNLSDSALNIPVLDKVFKQMRQFYKG